ncbi:type VI secretion system protein TssA [Methylobacterium sp. NEAU 140]|uniref:type VI secretion system protein TssA n=1 Tax=Methylobacterium sp. NEAU 140 TaxID=3064945 RepID=UPI00273380E8|nr:type VI secretion system protein TssA [Methylobacterium sp. NEAU 140]MDP4025124.1 type VI secretion system protein TssA [Methylobacterium sp. NEAU 140]
MSLPPVIDIEAILAPIAEDRPAGTDPRENASNVSPYYRLKDARAAARAEERAAIDADAPVPEAWSTVIDLAVALLASQAKDLEAATWLTEALIRVEGFAGLRDGITVLARLSQTFWDDLYPQPDEDGLEIRISPVAGLAGSGATGTLDRPIRNTPLTDGGAGRFSFWHFEQANDLEKIADPDRREARIAAGTISLETFRKSVAETPIEILRDTLLTLGECETAVALLSDTLDQAAGLDAPSFTPLQELLAAVAGCLRYVAADRLAASAEVEAVAAADAAPAADGSAAPGAVAVGGSAVRRPGEFENREEALTVLSQIGAYFRRTEPHSPISYTIEHAVRRGRMSLPELLKELARDPDHVQHILSVAGIKSSQDDE